MLNKTKLPMASKSAIFLRVTAEQHTVSRRTIAVVTLRKMAISEAVENLVLFSNEAELLVYIYIFGKYRLREVENFYTLKPS